MEGPEPGRQQETATLPAITPTQAAMGGAVRGMFTGLVLGILWGCWEEKKFVLRNCMKEYHLRECPTLLFAVMRRSVTTAPVVATFMGVHSGLRCWWHLQQQEAEVEQREQQVQREQPPGQLKPPGWDGAVEQLSTIPVHQPLMAGAAGTAAGAVRTLLSEAAAAMHPLVHAQRTAAAGLFAAGVFALGGVLEQEQQRQQREREQWEQQMGLADGD